MEVDVHFTAPEAVFLIDKYMQSINEEKECDTGMDKRRKKERITISKKETKGLTKPPWRPKQSPNNAMDCDEPSEHALNFNPTQNERDTIEPASLLDHLP
eukprot:335195_1